MKASIIAAVKAAAERARELGDAFGARATLRTRMFDQALQFSARPSFGLVTYAFLLRFAMQWLRAPFRNPLGQAVIALTDWAVKPLRRVVPGYRGLDWATLLLAWLAQFLWLVALGLLLGGGGARRPAHRRCSRSLAVRRARLRPRCGC